MLSEMHRLFVAGLLALCVSSGCSDDAPAGASGAGPGSGGGGVGGQGAGGNAAVCGPAVEPFGTEVGDSFPDVQLTSCDSTKVSLETVRCEADVTYLAVGASWCQPCQAEAPALEEAYQSLVVDQGLSVAITQVLVQGTTPIPATTQDCANWDEAYDLSFPVYVDPVGNTQNNFECSSEFPLNAIVARDGKVLWCSGEAPDDIEAKIKEYL